MGKKTTIFFHFNLFNMCRKLLVAAKVTFRLKQKSAQNVLRIQSRKTSRSIHWINWNNVTKIYSINLICTIIHGKELSVIYYLIQWVHDVSVSKIHHCTLTGNHVDCRVKHISCVLILKRHQTFWYSKQLQYCIDTLILQISTFKERNTTSSRPIYTNQKLKSQPKQFEYNSNGYLFKETDMKGNLRFSFCFCVLWIYF